MAAATDYASVAQQLYIAYFGRPADFFGLQGMENALLASGVAPTMDAIAGAYPKNAAIKAIFDNFGTSAESVALYGSGSDAAFINSIYMNVLNRQADLPGLSFWVNALGNGSMTRASAAVQIMAAASTANADATDLATTAAKTAVATNFTNAIDTAPEVIGYSGNVAAAQARAMLALVGSTTVPGDFQATVESTLNSIANPPPVIVNSNLTTAADNLPGTTGNDNFVGTVPLTAAGGIDASATLTAGDVVNGGVGTDSLSLSVSGSVTSGGAVTNTVNPNIKGVEKVLVSNVSAFSGTASALTTVVDLSLADSSLSGIGTNASTTAGVLTKFTNVGSLVAVEQAGKGNLEVAFNAAVVAGATDTLGLTLTGVGSAAIPATATAAVAASFKTTGVETLNISGNGVNVVSVDDAGLKTLNVTGSGATTVSFANIATLTKIDATAATGAVTIKGDGLALFTTGGAAGTIANGGTSTSDAFFTNQAIADSTALTNVKGFEILGLDGASQSVSLNAAINGLTTIDTSAASAQTVVLATGFTGNTAINLTGDGGAHDSITATASNVALTVSGNAVDFNNTTIAGGTGVDTLKLSADGTGSVDLSKITGFDNVTILANAVDSSKLVNVSGLISGTSGKTLTVDASALTNTTLFYAAGTGAGKLSITGGTGADTIQGSNSGDTIVSGAGADSIQAGSGADSINAGDGNDTINMRGNLTSADTIDGGSGVDTLIVDSVATGAFTNVTNIENVKFSANATTISLAAPLSAAAVTLDLTDGAAQSLTLATGFTGAATVKIGAADTVVNTANVALTVTGKSADFNADTITGGTGVDTLNITADTGTANTLGTASNLGSVTGVEAVNVLASTTLAQGANLTGVIGAAAGKTMTIDATAIIDTTAAFGVTTGAAAINSSMVIKGGAGINTINWALSSANTTVVGGGLADTFTAGIAVDSISGGAGNDTFIFGASNLTFDDTIDGGAGTGDVLVSATTATLGNAGEFAHVTGIETLRLTGANGGVSLGASSPAFTNIDIGAVTGVTAAAQTVTINPGFASAVNVAVTGNTNGFADSIVNTANVALTVTGKVADIGNTNETITGGTGIDTLALTADSSTTTFGAKITGIEQINLSAATVSSVVQNVNITLDAATIATGKTLTVDGSTVTGTITFNAAAEVAGAKLSITGGSASDTITGGAGTDTINGGAGNDVIDSGAGNDVLTGGTGNDIFVANLNSNKLTFASVADAAAGDAIRFNGATLATTAVPTQLTLNAAATLSDYLDAAAGSTSANTNGVLSWFQYTTNGVVNTYVVADRGAASTFNVATDKVVQLNGAIDLSTSNIVSNGTDAVWQIGAAAALPTALTYTGTAGADLFTGTGGADTFSFAATFLGATDTVTGGAGADTIAMTAADTLADAAFTKVTSVETLSLTGASTVALGSLAQAAGITNVTTGTAAVTITSTETTAITVNASALNGALTTGASSGAYTITGGVTDTGTTATGSSSAINLTLGDLTGNAHAFAAGSGNVTIVGGAANDVITVTGLATAAQSFTGSVAAFSVTAGAGIQTIVTGVGNDTVVGGVGADVINVGSGTDQISLASGAGATGGDTGVFATPATNTISTTAFDVVTGMGLGDKVQFTTSYTGAAGAAAGLIANGTAATTLVGLTLVDNGVEIVRGTYTASSNTFVGSATGTDSLFVYDSDATVGTTAHEAVVLVGYVAASVTGIGGAAGLVTLG